MAELMFTGTIAQALQAKTDGTIDKDTRVTITDDEYTSAELLTLIGSGAGKLTYQVTLQKTVAKTLLTGESADLVTILQGVNKYTGPITATGTEATVSELNTIANLTAGVVTATLDKNAAISQATITALNFVVATDKITFAPTQTTLANKADLQALIALKAKIPLANFSAITTIGAVVADIALVKQVVVSTPSAAVTMTGTITAADANILANATTGKVTATIANGAVKATLTALAKVDSDDAITFTTTDKAADAKDIADLSAKLSTFNAGSILTITATAATMGSGAVNVLTAIGKVPNAAVTITGAISATDAGLILDASDKVVTAVVTPGEATALIAGLNGKGTATDKLTLTVTGTSVDAADLLTLDGATALAVTVSAAKITGDYANIVQVLDTKKTGFAQQGTKAVDITETDKTAAQIDLILKATTGVVTATVVGDTAANLILGLKSAAKTDKLNLTVTGDAKVAELTALLNKTSGTITATGVTGITGTIAEITGLNGKVTLGTNIDITVTGVLTIAQANDMATKTGTGKLIGAVQAGTIATLNTLTTTSDDVINLTVTDPTVSASALTALLSKTSGTITVNSSTITGTLADVKAVVESGKFTLGTKAITISDDVTIDKLGDLNTILAATTGKVTAKVVEGTAAALNGLSNATATDALTLKVSASAATAEDLAGLVAKTSVKIDAKAVTSITGSIAHIKAIIASAKIDISTTAPITITDTTILAADANLVAKATSGVVTATVAPATAAVLKAALANTDTSDILTLTVSGPTATAADLSALINKTGAATISIASGVAISGTANDVGAVFESTKFDGLGTSAVTITGAVYANIVDIIAGKTIGVITATLQAESADILVRDLQDVDSNAKLTITVGGVTATAAELATLLTKTTAKITLSMTGEITGNKTEIQSLITNTAKFTGLATKAMTVSDVLTVAELKAIASATTGKVTATLDPDAPISQGTVTDLSSLVATDAITFKPNQTELQNKADLQALIALKAKIPNADFTNIEKITADVADIVLLKQVLAAGVAPDVNIVINGNISAQALGELAGLTTGTVTAAASGAVKATLKSLENAANGTVDMTFTTTDTTADAKDIVDLAAKFTNPSNFDATAITTITATADTIGTNAANVLGALDIVGEVAVTITGAISATDAGEVIAKTSGVVTATVAADTAANLIVNLDKDEFSSTDKLTLTVDGAEATATDLISLTGATSVAVAVDAVEITGTYAEVYDVYETNKASFTKLGNENVTISATNTAADINNILKATTGVVTATVAAASAADLLTALKDATATDILNLTVDGTVTVAQLKALVAKTAGTITATTIEGVEGTYAEVSAIKAQVDLGTAPKITITDAITAAEATIAAAWTSEPITATIKADSAANLLNALTDSKINIYTITVNGTSSAAELITLATKTTGNIVVNSTTIEGTLADVSTVITGSEFTGLTNPIITITGDTVAPGELADLNTILAATSGKVTATLEAASAADLNTTLEAAKNTDALTLEISASSTDAADLVALLGKTSVAINAAAATEITGNIANIKTVIASSSITKGTAVAITVDPSADISATDANLLANATTGIVTATVTPATAAALKAALANTGTSDVLTLTVTGTAAATDLTDLSGKTNTTLKPIIIDSGVVISGTASEVNAVLVTNAAKFTGEEHAAITITGTPSVSEVNAIAALTDGAVTATISDTVTNLANLTTGANDKISIAVSTTEPTAAELVELANKTSMLISLSSVTKITGASADIVTLFENVGKFTGLATKPIDVTGPLTAAQLNIIAGATTGKVTATLAPEAEISAATVNNLSNVNINDEISFTPAQTSLTDKPALEALIALKAKIKTLDFSAITTIEALAANITLVKQAVAITPNAAVTISGNISAADANAIANATSGKVTATITNGAIKTTLAALGNVTSTDDITFKATDKTADATDIADLLAKFADANKFDTTTITAITAVGANIGADAVKVTDALTKVGQVAVTITGAIAAADAGKVIAATDKVVTATISADTAANLIAGLDVTKVSPADKLTLTVNGATAVATDLISLDGATAVAVSVDAAELTGEYADIYKVYFTNKAGFAKLGDEKVTVSPNTGDTTISALNIDNILRSTTGVVTATITADTATKLLADLKNAAKTDVLNLTVTGDATVANLLALLNKTSGTIATDVSGITGTYAEVNSILANAKFTFSDPDITLTGTTTVANANAIAGATDGVVTATITAGTFTALSALTETTNKYALTVTDKTIAAANLTTLAGKTTGTVTVNSTEVTGSLSEVKAVIDEPKISALGAKAITISGTVAIADLADLNAILAGTTGKVTATLASLDVADVDFVIGTFLPAATATDAITITLAAGETTAAILNALDAKTSVAVDAALITKITGTVTEINTILASKTVTTGAAVNIVISGSATLAQVSAIAKLTTGTIEATLAADTIANYNKNLPNGTSDLNLVIKDTSATAADLKTLLGKTTGDINATTLKTLSGNVADLKEVLVTKATQFTTTLSNLTGVTIDGTVDAANAKEIADATTVAVTAKLTTDTAANLAAALDDTQVNAYTITVSAGTVNAADLATIQAKTSIKVNATAVTAITGNAADVSAIYTANNTNLSNSVAITLSDTSVEAAVANIIALKTAGVVTATLAPSSIAALKTILTDTTVNVYTIEVSDTTANAADLATIAGKTSGNVDANTVTTLSGTIASINALTAGGIANITNLAATSSVITDTSAAAADLSTLLTVTTTGVDASSATTLSGTILEIETVNLEAKFTKAASIKAVISDTAASSLGLSTLKTGAIDAIDASTVTTLTGTIANTTTVITDNTITLGNNVTAEIPAGDAETTTAALLALVNSAKLKFVNINLVDKITGSAADIKTILASTKVTNNAGDINLELTENSASAADLVAIKALTSGTVNIASVTTLITGSYNDVNKVFASYTVDGGVAITLSDTTLSASALNNIAAKTGGVVTATLAGNTKITDNVVTKTLADVNSTDVIGLISTETTADATALVALAAKLAGATENYSSIKTITENGAEVTTAGANVISALGLVSANAKVTISGEVDSASVKAINDTTSGMLTVDSVEIATGAFNLNTSLGDLSQLTGLNTINAANGGADTISISTADLLAANDSTGSFEFDIFGDTGDTVAFTITAGWSLDTANTQDNAQYVFKNGSKTITVNLTDIDSTTVLP